MILEIATFRVAIPPNPAKSITCPCAKKSSGPTYSVFFTDYYALLKTDPRHPSLHLKRVGRFWSVRVGTGHRALGVEALDGIVWIWIGTHERYNRLIRS
jgi:hypothetical protein